nr:MAK10-like protein [Tanacetum cinerariifolium]
SSRHFILHENHDQAFVEYASLHTDKARGKWFTFKPEKNNPGDTYNPSWKSHLNLSNSSSPKRVHSINTITILSKEDKPRETWIVKPNTKDNDHGTIVKVEEESKESEKEEKDNP